MKAVYLQAIKQPLEFVDLDKPTAGPGEVIVNIVSAALNHRDVFIQQGLYPNITLPCVLGSDGAGIVTEVGDDVDPTWLGQEVIINCSLNWGDNPAFYSNQYKMLGMPDNGTFAEYVKIEARYLYAKPAHLTFDEAAAVPLAGVTAWRVLISRTGLKSGEKVLITGIGGGVALFVLQFAVAAGAEVWVTSGSDEKIEKAIALGAKGGVNYKNPDWHKTLMQQTGGGRAGYFNVIIDSAGGPSFAKLIDCATPGGRIGIFGGTTGKISDLIPAKLFFKQLNIHGSTMGTDQEFADMVAFINQHQIHPIIDEVFTLAKAEEAFTKMDSGQQFGKIILRPN